MTERHTPGPWSADPEYEGDNAVVEALTADRRYVVREICHVLIDESDPEDWPVTRANLRLIAAAPALLAACEGAVKLCRCRGTGVYTKDCTRCGDSTDDHMCNDEERPCEMPPCVALRAAIAAARGGGE